MNEDIDALIRLLEGPASHGSINLTTRRRKLIVEGLKALRLHRALVDAPRMRLGATPPTTPRGDNSAVFSLSTLDAHIAGKLDPTKPWLFDNDEDGLTQFGTEEEACAAQRAYRTKNGFDPITGARVYPNGQRMFAADGMMLDDKGNRSIFDDVDG